MSNEFVDISLSKLRAALEAATEPLAVQKLHRDNIDIPTALFYDLFEYIVKAEDIGGFTRGRRENALFVPNAYREDQASKLCQFVRSNDYIDYQRLNTYHLYNTSPKDFLISHFHDMCFLDSCAVTSNVRLIMSAEIDEILGSNQWINVATLVPPVLSPLDISTLLASIADEKKDDRLVVLGSTYVASNEWLNKAYESLRQHMQLRALGARRAKTNGSQLQKTSKRGRQPSHDEDKLDKDQLLEALVKNAGLASEADLADLVVEKLFSQAQSEYANMLDSVYLPSHDPTTPTESKPKLGLLNIILSETWCRYQLFIKGTSVFDDSSVQSSLSKHLIRTLGQELVDMLIVFSAYKEGRKPFISALDQESDSRLNIELQDVQRDELINGMNADDRANASKARAIAIAGKPSEEFVNLVKNLMSNLDIQIDDSEQVQAQHLKAINDNLVKQLTNCNVQDAAKAPLALHLVVLIFFQALYLCPLHASGKFVPKIVRQITPKLIANNFSEYAATIEKCQDTIMKALKSGNVYTEQDVAILERTKKLGQSAAKDIA
ncbi:E3 UFM1-protein ligase 1 [Umbelopsis sp. WA50703]